jgi:hypothetical protein
MTPCSLKIIIGAILVVISCIQSTAQSTQVPMHQVGGVYMVDCTLNTIPLKFIFDSGASTCQIGLTEALFLFKNGHLTEEDVLDDVQLRIADGSSIEGLRINIKSLEVGGNYYSDIDAVIVKDLNAPLLLGQNILSTNAVVIIDYDNLTLNFLDEEQAKLVRKVVNDPYYFEKEAYKQQTNQILLQDCLDSIGQITSDLMYRIKQLEKLSESLYNQAENCQIQYSTSMTSNIIIRDIQELSGKIDKALRQYGKEMKLKSTTTIHFGPLKSSLVQFSLYTGHVVFSLEETSNYIWVYVPSLKRCGYIVK